MLWIAPGRCPCCGYTRWAASAFWDNAEVTYSSASTTPTALIVDWGGVLTGSLSQVMEAWTTAEGITTEHFATVMRRWFGREGELESLVNPVHTLERGELEVADFEQHLAEELTIVAGRPIAAPGLLGRLFSYFEHAPAMNALVVRAKQLGIRTALLSNSWGNNYPEHLFDGMFDAIVISGEVGLRKPEPEIYHHTLSQLQMSAHECVFVDDLQVNVEAAVKLGLIGVHHQDYSTTAAELSALFGHDLSR